MQVHQTDFSTGSVQRNIVEVAIPMIAAQLLNLLYNIVDRIYIGRIPGEGDGGTAYFYRTCPRDQFLFLFGWKR